MNGRKNGRSHRSTFATSATAVIGTSPQGRTDLHQVGRAQRARDADIARLPINHSKGFESKAVEGHRKTFERRKDVNEVRATNYSPSQASPPLVQSNILEHHANVQEENGQHGKPAASSEEKLDQSIEAALRDISTAPHDTSASSVKPIRGSILLQTKEKDINSYVHGVRRTLQSGNLPLDSQSGHPYEHKAEDIMAIFLAQKDLMHHLMHLQENPQNAEMAAHITVHTIASKHLLTSSDRFIETFVHLTQDLLEHLKQFGMTILREFGKCRDHKGMCQSLLLSAIPDGAQPLNVTLHDIAFKCLSIITLWWVSLLRSTDDAEHSFGDTISHILRASCSVLTPVSLPSASHTSSSIPSILTNDGMSFLFVSLGLAACIDLFPSLYAQPVMQCLNQIQQRNGVTSGISLRQHDMETIADLVSTTVLKRMSGHLTEFLRKFYDCNSTYDLMGKHLAHHYQIPTEEIHDPMTQLCCFAAVDGAMFFQNTLLSSVFHQQPTQWKNALRSAFLCSCETPSLNKLFVALLSATWQGDETNYPSTCEFWGTFPSDTSTTNRKPPFRRGMPGGNSAAGLPQTIQLPSSSSKDSSVQNKHRSNGAVVATKLTCRVPFDLALLQMIGIRMPVFCAYFQEILESLPDLALSPWNWAFPVAKLRNWDGNVRSTLTHAALCATLSSNTPIELNAFPNSPANNVELKKLNLEIDRHQPFESLLQVLSTENIFPGKSFFESSNTHPMKPLPHGCCRILNPHFQTDLMSSMGKNNFKQKNKSMNLKKHQLARHIDEGEGHGPRKELFSCIATTVTREYSDWYEGPGSLTASEGKHQVTLIISWSHVLEVSHLKDLFGLSTGCQLDIHQSEQTLLQGWTILKVERVKSRTNTPSKESNDLRNVFLLTLDKYFSNDISCAEYSMRTQLSPLFKYKEFCGAFWPDAMLPRTVLNAERSWAFGWFLAQALMNRCFLPLELPITFYQNLLYYEETATPKSTLSHRDSFPSIFDLGHLDKEKMKNILKTSLMDPAIFQELVALGDTDVENLAARFASAHKIANSTRSREHTKSANADETSTLISTGSELSLKSSKARPSLFKRMLKIFSNKSKVAPLEHNNPPHRPDSDAQSSSDDVSLARNLQDAKTQFVIEQVTSGLGIPSPGKPSWENLEGESWFFYYCRQGFQYALGSVAISLLRHVGPLENAYWLQQALQVCSADAASPSYKPTLYMTTSLARIEGEHTSAQELDLRQIFRVIYDTEASNKTNEPFCIALWDTINNFDISMKRKFVKFVTGIDTLPRPMHAVMFIVIPYLNFTRAEHEKALKILPTSHTCTNTLELPNYFAALKAVNRNHTLTDTEIIVKLREILQEKLTLAISAGGTVYGLDTIVSSSTSREFRASPNNSGNTSEPHAHPRDVTPAKQFLNNDTDGVDDDDEIMALAASTPTRVQSSQTRTTSVETSKIVRLDLL